MVGTYRERTAEVASLEQAGARLFGVDVGSPADVGVFADELGRGDFAWDVMISAVGVLAPIGPFFSLDFDAWQDSVVVNSLAQLRVLHALYPQRASDRIAKVVFFAGGGTNSAFDCYSAYCLGKLSLIKATELLDSEYPDLQVSIIGTGWVNTKIHRQTVAAGEAAGINFDKTRQFMSDDVGGASLERVAECVDWCLAAPRDAVGGRNFSLVHDDWADPAFVARLQSDPGSHKLRRRV